MVRRSAAVRREDYAYEDEQGEHWGGRLLREILEVAVLTLLIFMAVRLLVQNYRVDGPSMQPTLHTSEYILVDKAAYFFGTPARGDVVVFLYPHDKSKSFVKRIIGLPGDTVEVRADGSVLVNGKQLDEPYISTLANPYEPEKITVDADKYFVLGDNRIDSSDSRDWGLVPRDDIIGKASLVYWPLPDVQGLKNWSNVFAGVAH